MTKRAYKAKSGKMQYRPVFRSMGELESASEEGMGFCLACGEDQTGCEPDARKYVCESCGQPKVYGIEELAMMGLAIAGGSKEEAFA